MVLFVVTAAVYVAVQRAASDPLVHGDGHYTYLWARSIAFDGDLDLTNDYALCGDAWAHGKTLIAGGTPRNQWALGGSYVRSPLLVAARAVVPAPREPAAAAGCPGPLADLAMLGYANGAAWDYWAGRQPGRRPVFREGLPALSVDRTDVALFLVRLDRACRGGRA